MFSLYLALSIKTKCGSERWSERRDRVSFRNISALRAFAFVFDGDGKVKNTQLNKIPNLYDSRFVCKSYSASAR